MAPLVAPPTCTEHIASQKSRTACFYCGAAIPAKHPVEVEVVLGRGAPEHRRVCASCAPLAAAMWSIHREPIASDDVALEMGILRAAAGVDPVSERRDS